MVSTYLEKPSKADVVGLLVGDVFIVDFRPPKGFEAGETLFYLMKNRHRQDDREPIFL